ncbi:DUF2190 domain-containing protein [Corynebacterium sp. SCR221107]|uniref:DUF2190 domain-containing protein n=1 Tax=Corynebacterium sp. SCR221107 TaxID=3017361 RepID=UPI0022EC2410|nr:DUF2190 domain-containing protein [Corynebacterium sp. SCR221107]WBT08086.1 DUF2190 domain-containing protein [Corynebacterium sp. SCR221107]
MYTNQMLDRFNPGTDLTAVAATAVTGKTFLAYAGAMTRDLITVGVAGAGKPTAGVAKYDADANTLVGVARGAGRIVTVTAETQLVAGDPIAVGTAGKATKAVDQAAIVGYAANNADAGDDALVSLTY